MGQTALITGGTGGLGSAVVGAFLAGDWRVVAPWITRAEIDRLKPHPRLHLAEADLFDQASVQSIVALAAGDSDAPLKAVVNLVGGYSQPGRIHEASIDDFEAQLRLNLRPTYLVCQAAIPHLIAVGGGAIVCTSSRAAVAPFAGSVGYIAAKAAVLAFVRSLDIEYREDGIRANAILPSTIDTAANRASMAGSDFTRWVKPAEIAAVIKFLCSPESGPTSGTAIPVYGRA